MGGQVACMEERRNAYIILAGKPDGKKLFERSRSTRKQIFKIK
jgi:hypothetical protein